MIQLGADAIVILMTEEFKSIEWSRVSKNMRAPS